MAKLGKRLLTTDENCWSNRNVHGFPVCVNCTILDYRKMSHEAGGAPSAEVASDNLPPVNLPRVRSV